MEQMNLKIFMAMNAHAGLHGFPLLFSIFLARYLIYLVPLMMVTGWLWGNSRERAQMVLTLIAIAIGLWMAMFTGHHWFYPRPDVLGLGNTYLSHSADSSFPSDHMTVMWAATLGFLMIKGMRTRGLVILCASLTVAWARIFLGLHFPLDMIGAIVIATTSIILTKIFEPLIANFLTPSIERVYRLVFRFAIEKKWVKR